ncbi:MAG: hypothetical protein H8E28_08510 [Anaerolineae bacterium]|nr:hypothetical protein [Anaerolineae bacterium]
MKSDLFFLTPLMNAAGMLGFFPDPHAALDFSRLGAFITNPISRLPRTPANGTRYMLYPGGFLLHTGLPNPGLSQAIRRYGGYWASASLPVIVHLLAQNPDELAWMVERVERVEGVMGIEVGLPPDADTAQVARFARAALGELPVLVRVPLGESVAMGQAVMDAGASAVSLAAPRGSLTPGSSPYGRGEFVSGRLYGPTIFPQALRAVQMLTDAGIPVVGAGGVRSASDVESMLKAGASAVQVGASLWKNAHIPGVAATIQN